ncbi:hypothetical protein TNCT_145671 [Trichonephila clavata]|uniref:Uncharacterized protein n=1 Tax=Trichonephila clavata TaxID=2740835 RepID=A0A8X6FG69_TRICU|nr:hypothetical protein TNCT_145671 [Trichonephila clavata]
MPDFAFEESSEIYLVRWNGNPVVTVAINFRTLESFFGVKMRVRGHKGKVNVKIPNFKNSCNKHMSCVDYQDWLSGLYSIKFRGQNGVLLIRSLDMAMAKV